MQTYYDELEVPAGCPPEAIQAAFRTLIRKWHPDVYAGSREEASERTRRILEAYQVLKDPASRAEYDAYLLQRRRSAGSAASNSTASSSAAGSSARTDAHSEGSGTSDTGWGREESFSRQSETGRRAARQASVEVNWSLDEIMETVWKGSREHRQEASIGITMNAGFWGWLFVGVIALGLTGFGTIPAVILVRALWHSGRRAFAPNGKFVGFGTVLGGMALCFAIPVGGLLLLALLASQSKPPSTSSGSRYSPPYYESRSSGSYSGSSGAYNSGDSSTSMPAAASGAAGQPESGARPEPAEAQEPATEEPPTAEGLGVDAVSQKGESIDHFLRRLYPGARIREIDGGSGGISYEITKRDGSKLEVFVGARAVQGYATLEVM